MAEKSLPVSDLYARLQHQLGLDARQQQVAIEMMGGVVVLDGEVDDISTKRRVARAAREAFGEDQVEDRLTVRPTQSREDGAISTTLCETLLQESVFRRFSMNLWRKEEMHMIRDVPANGEGHLDVIVDNGVVTLAGEVWSLSHARMAELLAWWTPGVRGVINRLAIVPDEQDNDDEISDAVRLALDKDPLVQSEQIRVTTRDQVVILEGLVRGSEERQMAELDVWYLGSAVAGVSNQIQVKTKT
jgi:osmotically-inducible protein OsmY